MSDLGIKNWTSTPVPVEETGAIPPPTGANMPEYKGAIFPPPPCKPAKKELPDPPFGVKIAQEFSNKSYDEATKVIKDAIWRDVVREIKQGSKRSVKYFHYYPRHYFSSFIIDDEEKAIKILGTKLLEVLLNFGKEVVKNGYAVRVENDVEPDTYLDTETNRIKRREVGFRTYELDSIKITICWEEKFLEGGAFLEYIDRSGPAIRRLNEDNIECFTCSCKKTITTKEELENGNQDNG